MNWGGLGRPWAFLRRLFKLLVISQALSPLVALVVVLVAASTGATTVDSPPTSLTTVSSTPPPVQEVVKEEKDLLREVKVKRDGEDEGCCSESVGESVCPRDYPSPSLAQLNSECGDNTTLCSDLPLLCMTCKCDYNCQYGNTSTALCVAREGVKCAASEGIDSSNIPKEFTCSYCFLTEEAKHSCSTRDLGCRSVGSPTSNHHWYVANCTSGPDTICLGKQVFSKRVECNWTEGYSWRTTLVLSVTLGGFGADRFYLGHWQEGIGKLFSFGGLGVWTLVDVVLVAIGYIGPADGSLYI